MRVRCLSNSASDLSTPWQVGFGDGRTDLEVGKEYVVYAVEWSDGVPGYILCGERYSFYPLHYPAELFEITDPTPSRYWAVGFQPARPLGTTGHVVPPQIVLGFPEWVADWGFHYWITEGRSFETATWQRYKKIIDAEADDRRQHRGRAWTARRVANLDGTL